MFIDTSGNDTTANIITIGNNTATGDASGFFVFPAGAVKAGQDNVVTVLMDHMGNDEDQNR